MRPKVVVLGCGNILRGDDGFGPLVVQNIKSNYEMQAGVELIDAGLAGGELLLDIMLEDEKPKELIIVDSIDMGRKPGELVEFEAQNLVFRNTVISSHQFPNHFLIEQLIKNGVKVIFVSCQTGLIPNQVSMRLSGPVAEAIPKAAKIVATRTDLREKEIK